MKEKLSGFIAKLVKTFTIELRKMIRFIKKKMVHNGQNYGIKL